MTLRLGLLVSGMIALVSWGHAVMHPALPALSENEMSRRVGGDPCGAVTNLVWSACGWDGITCESKTAKIIVNAPNIQIPGTGISLPFGGQIYEFSYGCTSLTGAKEPCPKKQHEQAVSAPGYRINRDFPPCEGIYRTYNCKVKHAQGFTLHYPVWVPTPLPGHIEWRDLVIGDVPIGCEADMASASEFLTCPNKYQRMTDCRNPEPPHQGWENP